MPSARRRLDPRLPAVLLLLPGLLLIAGCSGRQWDKPEVTQEELTAAIGDCERQAYRQAEAEAFAGRGGPNTAVIEVDRARGIARDAHAGLRRSANLTESARRAELFRECMLAKGFRPVRS